MTDPEREEAGKKAKSYQVRWRELPRLFARWFRIMRAWENEDWPAMAALLEPVVRERQTTDGDVILLGHAYTKLGRLQEAAWYFEEIDGSEPLSKGEKMAYCNSYAYALARTGRLDQAKQHVAKFERSGWPEAQRQWGDRLLESGSAPGEVPHEPSRPKTKLH